MVCHSLLLLPSIFPSIRIFSNELALHIRWPKYWSFSFSTSPSSEYSELISFRMDWFDFFVVQVTLKSLLQHHSLKHHFFVWNTQTFLSKVTSLLLNTFYVLYQSLEIQMNKHILKKWKFFLFFILNYKRIRKIEFSACHSFRFLFLEQDSFDFWLFMLQSLIYR